jgi:hypothetical protein
MAGKGSGKARQQSQAQEQGPLQLRTGSRRQQQRGNSLSHHDFVLVEPVAVTGGVGEALADASRVVWVVMLHLVGQGRKEESALSWG